jgi:hypothetical protein
MRHKEEEMTDEPTLVPHGKPVGNWWHFELKTKTLPTLTYMTQQGRYGHYWRS